MARSAIENFRLAPQRDPHIHRPTNPQEPMGPPKSYACIFFSNSVVTPSFLSSSSAPVLPILSVRYSEVRIDYIPVYPTTPPSPGHEYQNKFTFHLTRTWDLGLEDLELPTSTIHIHIPSHPIPNTSNQRDHQAARPASSIQLPSLSYPFTSEILSYLFTFRRSRRIRRHYTLNPICIISQLVPPT